MQPENRILTIGHSNHEPEAFLELLRLHGVSAVADVRSSPYSRRQPHFGRGPLEGLLRHHEIVYVFLGKELGGRPSDPSLYDAAGWADYERIRATKAFATGLERLQVGLENYTVAMMCGEEDPMDCHRGLMIAPALAEIGLPPRHIRKGGSLETAAEFDERIQREAGIGALFGLSEALRVLNARKAYRLEASGWGE